MKTKRQRTQKTQRQTKPKEQPPVKPSKFRKELTKDIKLFDLNSSKKRLYNAMIKSKCYSNIDGWDIMKKELKIQHPCWS